MISGKMLEALNEQLNKEMYSAYLYMAMSAACTSRELKGFANWFMVQYQEEMAHAMKFYDYIHRQGNRVNLMAIDQPQIDFESPLAMFEKTLAHEQFVTGLIHGLVDLSSEENDKTTKDFLQWFVKEQIEEEETAGGLLERVKSVDDSGEALLKLNTELADRVFHPPKPTVD
ncbi:MAG: ferritin [Chloroflexi bacterium]|jgi:ferritin|nr:ferritin [Chloroflexota bacterium]